MAKGEGGMSMSYHHTIQAYELVQSHHALRAWHISRDSAGSKSELFGIMTTKSGAEENRTPYLPAPVLVDRSGVEPLASIPHLVDSGGIEPPTSAMRMRRSTN